MLYWIFDLDQTLYQLPYNKNFSYDILETDSQLRYLLKKLPFYRLLFTNGTTFHADTCMNKLSIKDCFHNVIARDTIRDLKPNYGAYEKFISLNNIKIDDKCIFFEDSIENLIVAKDKGWITVLITPNIKQNVHENIDFYFPNIFVALNYFNSIIDTHLQ